MSKDKAIYDLVGDLGAGDKPLADVDGIFHDLVRYLDGDTIKNFVADFRRNNDLNHSGEVEEEDGALAEDLVDIIMHRIKMNKKLMLRLSDNGPDPLMNSVEIVADQYSGTTEVGSSDVSAMVDAVIRTMYPLDWRAICSRY